VDKKKQQQQQQPKKTKQERTQHVFYSCFKTDGALNGEKAA
jgi:hypothetical protein